MFAGFAGEWRVAPFITGQQTLRVAALSIDGIGLAKSGRTGSFWENVMQPRILIVPCVALMFLAAGCGESPDQHAKADAVAKLNDAGSEPPDRQAKADAAAKLNDAGKQMARAAKDSRDAAAKGGQRMAGPMAKMDIAVAGAAGDAAKSVVAAVEPVDFRELRVLLPERIGALKLTSTVGKKDSGPSIAVSHAEGRYQGEDASLDLTITDPGTLSEFAATAPIWMNMELDRETDNGYEKTGNANGRRFHEVYDDGSKFSEYSVIVGNRFMVEIHGNGVDMPTTKQAIDQIDLARLEAMKDVGTRN